MRVRFRSIAVMSLLAVGCLVVSCSGGAPPNRATQVVEAGSVAQCGGVSWSAAMVAAVAAEQKVTPRQAVELLAQDARIARFVEQNMSVAYQAHLKRGALARALLRQLKEQSQGPTTAAELAVVRERHWFEVDHGEAVVTVHAVVMANRTDPEEKRKAAQGLAEQIGDAVKAARTADEFVRLAKAVPTNGQSVQVESLPAVLADYRVLGPDSGNFDADFTKGAFALGTVGAISSVVESAFGFHVIMLVERVPAVRVADEQLAVMSFDEVIADRARASLDQLLEGLKRQTPVEVDRASETLMAGVDVGGPQQ